PLNGAQKGYKSQTYPGGTHTPMFMWWKGKLQPGNYDKLISAMDFYPTALDAADISIPKDLKLDGVSLLPWLQDKKQGEPHKHWGVSTARIGLTLIAFLRPVQR
ncbi:sulfatase-like hydrolase/transferase, partial [Escherichia sp. HC-CC]